MWVGYLSQKAEIKIIVKEIKIKYKVLKHLYIAFLEQMKSHLCNSLLIIKCILYREYIFIMNLLKYLKLFFVHMRFIIGDYLS